MSCIEDKVILITGASSGFGMVTAKKCVEHGAKVVLGARTVSYTHLRAHETGRNLVCRLLLEKKKKKQITIDKIQN